MRSWVPSLLIGGVAISISILSAGACGGSTSDSPAAADASNNDEPIDEAAAPVVDAGPPYDAQTTRCVAAAYTNPITDPTDGSVNFVTDDAGDDDAGTSFGLPQLTSFGGPVFKTPRILPITYLGDPLADEIEDFVGSIGCTDYWRTVVSEYGIGEAQMLTPVRISTAAAASLTDSDISSFLVKQLEAKAPGFTDPSSDVIYAFFFPTGTTIEYGGDQSCTSFGGYHGSVQYAAATVSYAVIPRCGGGGVLPDGGFVSNPNDFASISSAASHEFIEASTDPYPDRNPAYVLPDNDHIAFSMLGGGEAGDLCEFSRSADFTPTGYPFSVQRTWSNASILAGHDPCVPAQPGPYLSGIPDQPDTISVMNTGITSGASTTRGVAIPVGGTRTIDVHFHSDDPTVTSWTISASDAARFSGDTPHLTLTLDTTTATVGQVAHLTITVNSQGTVYGAEPFIIRSTSAAKTSSSWIGVVGMP